MKINLILCAVLFFALAVVFPTAMFLLLKRKQKLLKRLTVVLFFVYLCLLFVGTTATVGIENLDAVIGFDFSNDWFSLSFVAFGLGKLNIILNLFLLFPVGYVVFLFSKKHRVLKTILVAFFMSLIIETYQWILPINRNTEIFDVILNTASGLISAMYCKLISRFGAFD